MALAPCSTAPPAQQLSGPQAPGASSRSHEKFETQLSAGVPATHHQLRVGDGVRVTLCPDSARCPEQSAGQSMLIAWAHRAPVGVLAPLGARARNFRGP